MGWFMMGTFLVVLCGLLNLTDTSDLRTKWLVLFGPFVAAGFVVGIEMLIYSGWLWYHN